MEVITPGRRPGLKTRGFTPGRRPGIMIRGFTPGRWLVCATLLLVAAEASAQVEKPKKIEIRPKGEQKPEVVAPGPVAPNIPGVAATAPQGAPLKTTIEIDITSTSQAGDPAAQNWGKVFEELGYSTRIRVGRDAQAGVTEKVRGSLRNVSVSAILSRSGELIVGNKSFTLTDKAKLEEWLEELKLYGAQGAPEGKPLWGLNREQFVIVNDQMTAILSIDPRQKTIEEFVGALTQSGIPIRLPTATQDWLRTSPAAKATFQSDLTGFSTGTGLAIALNELGAGMRPVRTPSGQIEYEIKPLDQMKDAWPMGWEPKAEVPRDRITPYLFQQGVVGFEKSPLVEVLTAIATESQTPIIIDTRRSLLKKVDVSQIQVSYPQRKVAWALVVSQCVREAKLYNYYRQDEAGLGFVLIAPFEPKPAEAR